MKTKKAKALVLFSGGLDSILVVRLLQSHGIAVEGLNIETPFYPEYEKVKQRARMLGIKLHTIRTGREYFALLKNPKHGYGANMNPCIDCRAYMLRKAEEARKRTGADFLATGEVLGERPFSQTRDKLFLIEKEAGLRERVVRPLSGKLLPSTEAEKNGLIKREWLLDIQGRSRKRQLSLARKFGISDFPSPAGGCLLTDSSYSRRLRDLLEHGERIGWRDAELLKMGRHFRVRGKKIIVGRNERENMKLMGIARKSGLGWLETKVVPGPVAVIPDKRVPLQVIIIAASLAARYSDVPQGKDAEIELCTPEKKQPITVRPLAEEEAKKMMI